MVMGAEATDNMADAVDEDAMAAYAVTDADVVIDAAGDTLASDWLVGVLGHDVGVYVWVVSAYDGAEVVDHGVPVKVVETECIASDDAAAIGGTNAVAQVLPSPL